MPSLYELTQDVMYLQSLLENGEIEEQVYKDSVEGLCIDHKFEDICMVIKNLEAKAQAFKTEIDRMTSRKRTLENSVQRLKDSMLNHLVVANETKVDAGVFTVGIGKSKSVFLTNESAIPKEYLIPQPNKIDKAAISKALKAGEDVEGAVLVENPFLTIR